MSNSSRPVTAKRWLLPAALLFGLVLPILHIRYFLHSSLQQMVHDTHRRHLNDSQLAAQTVRIAVQPERVMRPYLRSLVLGKGNFRLLQEEIHRKYPGAWHFFVWNQEGRLLYPKAVTLTDYEQAISFLARTILRFGNDSKHRYEANPFSPEIMHCSEALQRFFGPELSLDKIIYSFRTWRSFTNNNQERMVSWDSRFIRSGRNHASEDPEKPWGFFVVIRPDLLPPDFFCRLALSGFSEALSRRVDTLALIDHQNPASSFLQKGLPASRRFVRDVTQKYSAMGYPEVFSYAGFRIRRILAWPHLTKTLFLFTPIPEILQQQDEMRATIDAVLRLLLFFGGLIALLLFGIGSTRWPLVMQVSLLMAGAVVLPLSASIWQGFSFWRHWGHFQDQNDQTRIRDLINLLPRRKEVFQTIFGYRLLQQVKAALPALRTEAALAGYLEGIRQTGLQPDLKPGFITDYVLADQGGRPAYSSFQGPREFKMIIDTVINRYASLQSTQSTQSASGNLMGEVLLEELGKLQEGGVISELAPRDGCLNRITWARTQMIFLPLTIACEDIHRTILISIHEALIEQHFLQDEIENGILARLKREFPGEIKIILEASGLDHLSFGPVDLFKDPELWPLVFQDQETRGTVSHEGFDWWFFSAQRGLLHSYRVVILRKTGYMETRARAAAGILLALLLLATPGLLFMGGTITRMMVLPLRELAQAFGRVGNGELICLPAPVGNDEIARLRGFFNETVLDLREKERMTVFLSEAVVTAIKTEAVRGAAGVEQREITVLFSDIRGFTTISEQHSPETIFSLLNDYFAGIEPLIREHGGQVQKYIGDAVYVVFPQEGRDGAFRAVASALAVKDFLLTFNDNRTRLGFFPLNVGFGIATGPMLWGKIGSETRQDFVFVGQEISRAATLEGCSKESRYSGIMLAPRTKELLADSLEMETQNQTIEVIRWKNSRPDARNHT
jgi:class 3 adenylate cyclase/ligand-binding SRPBCC domain-containing protein